MEVIHRRRHSAGLRLNYDEKNVDFDQQIYGGLQTTDPALVALQLSVLAPQQYAADVDDTNLSGQFTVAFKCRGKVNTYSTLTTFQVRRPESERRADRRVGRPGAVGRDRDSRRTWSTSKWA